jgi:hypothetical protein
MDDDEEEDEPWVSADKGKYTFAKNVVEPIKSNCS